MDPGNECLDDVPERSSSSGGNGSGATHLDATSLDDDVDLATDDPFQYQRTDDGVFSVMCAFGGGFPAIPGDVGHWQDKRHMDLDLKSSPTILMALHETSQETIDRLRGDGSEGKPEKAHELRKLSGTPGLLNSREQQELASARVACRPTYEFLVESGDEAGLTTVIAGRSSFCESLTTLLWERVVDGVYTVDRKWVPEVPGVSRLLLPRCDKEAVTRIQIVRVRFKQPVCGMHECVVANVHLHRRTAKEDPPILMDELSPNQFNLCKSVFNVCVQGSALVADVIRIACVF